jgi:hypothetical protein
MDEVIKEEGKEEKPKKEKFSLIKFFAQRVELLRNDKKLSLIFFLHLLLIALHVYENYVGNIEYHWYLRAGGCGLISFCIFFFGRKGLAWALMIYACVLVYINNFYNYATIFFMLVAIGADPKLKKVAPLVYLLNVFIAFTIKRFGITPFSIHLVYCLMFYTKIGYVFAIHKPETLNLTQDEKNILEELAKGKMQKEIDLFSQQTISGKLKNSRERNLLETTADLIIKYKEQKNN